METRNFERSNGSLFQLLFRLLREHCFLDQTFILLIPKLSAVLFVTVVPVLLRVDSQALGHEVHFNPVDVLYQTSNGWEELLGYVPVNVQFQCPSRAYEFIRVISFLTQMGLRLVHFADDVLDEVVINGFA